MDERPNLIEQFVAALNQQGLEPLFDDAVPAELRTNEVAGIRRMFDWQILAAHSNPWAVALEQKLPFPFPPLYHELINRFRFAEFESGPIMFLANTGAPVFNELSEVLFRDKTLSPMLLQNGLLQFGREAGGGYDPICFDLSRRIHGDAFLVRIDHEDVLIRGRIRVRNEIARTFQSFIEEVIAGLHSDR